MVWQYLIEGPWVVFCVYWVVGALKTRRTVSQEPAAGRLAFMLVELLGFALLFSEHAGIGVLGKRIFHQTDALAVAGVALTWVGIALALWARWHLGEFWSARITLKEDHVLIRAGP